MNISEMIKYVHEKSLENIEKGFGPFYAVVCDAAGNIISEASNSVINDMCSNCHAEMNAIKMAEKKLGNYDLSSYNLSICITAEPCMMCIGAILWSGIKKVYFSVSTKDVEEITGFDEGFKPNWEQEFKKRGIEVYGGIEVEKGKEILKKYVASNKTIYKPARD